VEAAAGGDRGAADALTAVSRVLAAGDGSLARAGRPAARADL
jgi:hypothetical protein